MIVIKIYDKNFNIITRFSENEFDHLGYEKAINRAGSARFTVALNNPRVTEKVLQHYNRVEIVSSDRNIGDTGTVRFVGYIDTMLHTLDVVDVRCRSLIAILGRRVLEGEHAVSGSLNTEVESILNTINTEDDTGIEVGRLNLNNAVNKVFNNTTALSILETFARTVDCQFEVDSNRKLNIDSELGKDLSKQVIFQYDINKKEQANILTFKTEDDGDQIVSRSYGRAVSGDNILTSTQESEEIRRKYGLLEKFNNFRVSNSQSDLDNITGSVLQENIFTLEIDLNPATTQDNFDIGDLVSVRLYNKLIRLNRNYQILQKVVQYEGKQTRIKTRISALPVSFVDSIGGINKRLELLESNI